MGVTRLPYTIVAERGKSSARELSLVLHYPPWTTLGGAEVVSLIARPGKPILALCPGEDCGRAVRKLHLPPEGLRFLCRHCHGLVYRPDPHPFPADARQAVRELLPNAHRAASETDLAALQEALLSRLAAELPLGPQELRLYCQRLSETGLSLREIAALVGASKSSMQRLMRAGIAGVDMDAFVTERVDRHLGRPHSCWRSRRDRS